MRRGALRGRRLARRSCGGRRAREELPLPVHLRHQRVGVHPEHGRHRPDELFPDEPLPRNAAPVPGPLAAHDLHRPTTGVLPVEDDERHMLALRRHPRLHLAGEVDGGVGEVRRSDPLRRFGELEERLRRQRPHRRADEGAVVEDARPVEPHPVGEGAELVPAERVNLPGCQGDPEFRPLGNEEA